jgi:hypothetical protein
VEDEVQAANTGVRLPAPPAVCGIILFVFDDGRTESALEQALGGNNTRQTHDLSPLMARVQVDGSVKRSSAFACACARY